MKLFILCIDLSYIVLEVLTIFVFKPFRPNLRFSLANDLSMKNGKIKLLFATEAYGMGTDAPDIHQIIHIGPPSSLEILYFL